MSRRYIVRILSGWMFWLVLLAVYYNYQYWGRDHLPNVLRTAAEVVMSIVAFAAWPMALAGWLMWGEGWWIFDIGPNIVIGLALYGALGTLAGTAYDRIRKRSER